MPTVNSILLLLLAYVIGSIPTGYWLGKILKKIDIREHGSRSTGATNVYRCVGKIAGVTTLVVDMLKGYLPVILALHLEHNMQVVSPISNLVPIIVASVTIVGHSKSIFLSFNGGKSAATGLGSMFALNVTASLIVFTIWISLVLVTRIVSLASIMAALSLPIAMYLCQVTPAILLYSALAALYVIVRHKENIKRLMNGTELRFDRKQTPNK